MAVIQTQFISIKDAIVTSNVPDNLIEFKDTLFDQFHPNNYSKIDLEWHKLMISSL